MEGYGSGAALQEEFMRLMRAIYESLERESELQRQLRRTKETLVSVALRLQVALKAASEDELTISTLLSQAEDARTKELIAQKRSEEATSVINQLNMEVNSLKRKLFNLEIERTASLGLNSSGSAPAKAGILSVAQQQALNEEADREVEQFFYGQPAAATLEVPHSILMKDVSEKAINMATPFDRWKMSQLLFVPDTPAASAEHDKHVVDMLIEHTSSKSLKGVTVRGFNADNHFDQQPDQHLSLTQSSLAKVRRLQNRNNHDFEMRKHLQSTSGANDFETLADKELANLDTLLSPVSAFKREDTAYFRGASAEQSWSPNQQFERLNLGRNNLWVSKYAGGTSSANINIGVGRPSSSFKAEQVRDNVNRNVPGVGSSSNSSVRLKSLRRNDIVEDMKTARKEASVAAGIDLPRAAHSLPKSSIGKSAVHSNRLKV